MDKYYHDTNIAAAISFGIEREIIFLASYDIIKKAIQEIIDMPDNQIDLFIKLVLQNKGSLSANKRTRFFPSLSDDEITQITIIINNTMKA